MTSSTLQSQGNMPSSPLVIPAILETSFGEVQKKLALVEGLASWAQVDICDGLFAGPETWRDPELLNLVEGKIKIEAHLMVEHPENELVEWSAVADRIIVHYEATDELARMLDGLNESVIKFGVALSMDTPVEVLRPFLNDLSYVQLMGIAEIGGQGHTLDERIFSRITQLRALAPDATIAIDGGVTLDNVTTLKDAGATNFIVGSALFRSKDVPSTLAEFQNRINGTSA